MNSGPIYVSGHSGMVGQAVLRKLSERGESSVITARHSELDLTNQAQTFDWFQSHRPEKVFHIAAKVGGIEANRTNQAGFLYENLMIQANVLAAAHEFKVGKLLTLGSSCMYPRECPQPMKEEMLLAGPFEPTNEGYAIAKTAGVRLAGFYNRQYGDNFISAIPCNLYGPGDNYDPRNSHVLGAFIRRFVAARNEGLERVILWGTGSAFREFLHVDDMADALLILMDRYESPEPVNVGAGTDISILDLAHLVARIAGYEGKIEWDRTMPDGMPRKLMDNSRIGALGWMPKISLEAGVEAVMRDYELALSVDDEGIS